MLVYQQCDVTKGRKLEFSAGRADDEFLQSVIISRPQ